VAVHANGALIDEGKADTLTLGEGNESVLAGTNAENVVEAGGEGVALAVLDVGNLVGTGMVLNVLEDTNTTNVVSADNEDGGTVLELDNGINFTSLEVELRDNYNCLLLTLTESLILMSGWGKRMVLPSWVTT
jgi:hypothetical protein